MAYTAATGFRLYEGIDMDSMVVLTWRHADSATVRIGDIVRINTAGNSVRALTGEVVGGVVLGIVDSAGTPLNTAFFVNNTGATLTGDDTVATASDNTTRTSNYVQVQVAFDPAGQYLYYNKADSALALTNMYQFFDVATSNQVTVGTASDANGQLQLIKIDPDNDGTTTKGLFRINENQHSTGIDTATAKNAA